MNTDYPEISKLLFSSFNNNLPNISSEDLVRLWALKLQWFNPADSNLVLLHLLNNNWLLESINIIYPNPNVELIPPTLGWQPILREILNLPYCLIWLWLLILFFLYNLNDLRQEY